MLWAGKLKFSLPGATAPKKTDDPGYNPPTASPEARRFNDGLKLGYIARLAQEMEGEWSCLGYPRSQWLCDQLAADSTESGVDATDTAAEGSEAQSGDQQPAKVAETFGEIAAFADLSEMHSGGGGGSGLLEPEREDFHRLCSRVVALDRNEFAVEQQGYRTRVRKMQGLENSAKADLLMGWLPT